MWRRTPEYAKTAESRLGAVFRYMEFTAQLIDSLNVRVDFFHVLRLKVSRLIVEGSAQNGLNAGIVVQRNFSGTCSSSS